MMYKTFQTLSALLLIGLVLTPGQALASTKKPSCSLEATTSVGTTHITKDEEVMVRKGDQLTISWESDNATKATLNKESIALSGSTTTYPTKNGSYEFRFNSGSKKAVCEIEVHVVEGSFDSSSLSSTSGKPTITGEVTGSKSVQVVVKQAGSTKVLWKSSKIKAKNGEFSTKVKKELNDGSYEITLLGEKGLNLNTIARRTLVIGNGPTSTNSSSTGRFSVGSVPLLFGGSISRGASTPVTYLKIKNLGVSTASFTGIRVKQAGNASADAITALEVRNDKGMTVGQGNVSFASDKTAVAPALVTLQAGETALFTIRATLSGSATPGSQLIIDVLSLAGATANGIFPIKGVSWTVR